MRVLFWTVTGLGLLLMLLGLWYFDVPILTGVVGSVFAEWYLDRLVRSALLGAVVGGIWAMVTRRRTLHVPRESGVDYAEKVAGHGLLAQFLGILLLLTYLYVAASRASFIPLSPWDRFLEVLFALKFLGVLGANLAATGVVFAVAVRAQRWGGRYALLSPQMTPTIGREV